jgi:hypothetical protein
MHYSIDRIQSLADLKDVFPEPIADEMNFCLFSTSGVHGTYTTIEEAEAEPDGEVTILVVHPRTVTLRYGNIPVDAESAPYLKALRASSWDVMRRIGADRDVCTCEPQNAYLCLRCERIAENQDIGF